MVLWQGSYQLVDDVVDTTTILCNSYTCRMWAVTRCGPSVVTQVQTSGRPRLGYSWTGHRYPPNVSDVGVVKIKNFHICKSFFNYYWESLKKIDQPSQFELFGFVQFSLVWFVFVFVWCLACFTLLCFALFCFCFVLFYFALFCFVLFWFAWFVLIWPASSTPCWVLEPACCFSLSPFA